MMCFILDFDNYPLKMILKVMKVKTKLMLCKTISIKYKIILM